MTLQDLQSRVKRLSLRATDAKMALHDLSEELPTDWEKIPQVAESTFAVFRELNDARKALKAATEAAETA